MELLKQIYPYTIYTLYAVIFITIIVLLNLLIKSNRLKKQIKLTLEPLPNITSNIAVTKEKLDFINTKTRAQINSAKDFLSYASTAMVVLNLVKKRKRKRRK